MSTRDAAEEDVSAAAMPDVLRGAVSEVLDEFAESLRESVEQQLIAGFSEMRDEVQAELRVRAAVFADGVGSMDVAPGTGQAEADADLLSGFSGRLARIERRLDEREDAELQARNLIDNLGESMQHLEAVLNKHAIVQVQLTQEQAQARSMGGQVIDLEERAREFCTFLADRSAALNAGLETRVLDIQNEVNTERGLQEERCNDLHQCVKELGAKLSEVQLAVSESIGLKAPARAQFRDVNAANLGDDSVAALAAVSPTAALISHHSLRKPRTDDDVCAERAESSTDMELYTAALTTAVNMTGGIGGRSIEQFPPISRGHLQCVNEGFEAEPPRSASLSATWHHRRGQGASLISAVAANHPLTMSAIATPSPKMSSDVEIPTQSPAHQLKDLAGQAMAIIEVALEQAKGGQHGNSPPAQSSTPTYLSSPRSASARPLARLGRAESPAASPRRGDRSPAESPPASPMRDGHARGSWPPTPIGSQAVKPILGFSPRLGSPAASVSSPPHSARGCLSARQAAPPGDSGPPSPWLSRGPPSARSARATVGGLPPSSAPAPGPLAMQPARATVGHCPTARAAAAPREFRATANHVVPPGVGGHRPWQQVTRSGSVEGRARS